MQKVQQQLCQATMKVLAKSWIGGRIGLATFTPSEATSFQEIRRGDVEDPTDKFLGYKSESPNHEVMYLPLFLFDSGVLDIEIVKAANLYSPGFGVWIDISAPTVASSSIHVVGPKKSMTAEWPTIISNLFHQIARSDRPTVAHQRSLEGESEARLPRTKIYKNNSIGNSLVDVFRDQVAVSPSQPAVGFMGHWVSYLELNRTSDLVALNLSRRGVKAHDFVAIRLDRSIELIIVILGVLKAGATYVPIDINHPLERALSIVSSNNIHFCVTDESESNAWLSNGNIDISTFRDLSADGIEKEMNLPLGPTSDYLAYVIFTSGSTGAPKGVKVSHLNCLRLFRAASENLKISHSDVWSMVHSPAFDVSVWEIWGALLHGGRLVVVPTKTIRTPQKFKDLVVSERISVLSLTPSAFDLSKQALLESATELSLRAIVFAGEKLLMNSLQTWFNCFGDRGPKIVNMYGITETTVHSTWREIKPDDALRADSPIGIPLCDLEIKIIDEQGYTLPKGFVGEMLVGGDGVTQGYLNSPELTAERFLDSEGLRWYCSGDFAYIDETGELIFVGRRDHQVKIRGYRIELTEISSELLRFPGVSAAHVSVLESKSAGGEKRLVAWVVPSVEGLDIARIKEGIAQRLPEYMRPGRIIEIDSFPLTINGKIDRLRLSVIASDSSAEYPAAQHANSRETIGPAAKLLKIFRFVLKYEEFSENDNFFEFGGDSLLVLKLISLAQIECIPLTVEAVWQSPSINSLVEYLKLSKQEIFSGYYADSPQNLPNAFELVSNLDREDIPTGAVDAYPLTELQAGMIFHSIEAEGRFLYHDLFIYGLTGSVDPVRFVKAVKSVFDVSPILRSTFHVGSYSKPIQIVNATITPPVEFLEVESQVSEVECRNVAIRWLKAEQLRGWKLDTAPPIRIAVVLESGTHNAKYLALSFHHCLLDGWSVATFVTAVLSAYGARSASPPRLFVQRGFAGYLKAEKLASQNLETKQFWTQYLQSGVISLVPRTPGTKSEDSVNASWEDFHEVRRPLSFSLTSSLDSVARSLGVSAKSVYATAVAATVSLFASNEVPFFGLVTNGRIAASSTNIFDDLGLYLNTVPIRIRTSNVSWRNAIRNAHSEEAAIIPHRRFPYSKIRELCEQTPFNLVLNFTDFSAYSKIKSDWPIKLKSVQYFEKTEIDLVLYVHRDGVSGDWSTYLSYQSEYFSQSTAEQLISAFLCFLEDIALDLESSADQTAPFGNVTEVSIRLDNFPTREPSRQSVRLLDDFLKHTVSSFGSGIAVKDRETQATFAELDEMSSSLSSYLLSQGIGPGFLIPICAERGMQQIAAMIGVLRVGAAFVQVDHSLPKLRISECLDQVGAPLVLVSESLRFKVLNHLVVSIRDVVKSGYTRGRPFCQREETDAAYAVFTSGTTGRPKLVRISHATICNLINWHCQEQDDLRQSPSAQIAACGFDVAVQEVFVAIATGSPLYSVPEEIRSMPDEIIRFLMDNQIERLFLPTAMLAPLAAAGIAFDLTPNALRRVFVAGEALQIDSVTREFFARLNSCSLSNQYGPCETHVATGLTLDKDPFLWDVRPAVGVPVYGSAALVADHQGRCLPKGAEGNIWLTGVCVGMGYLNDSELTAKKFYFNRGTPMFATGDRGFIDGQGQLHCLGRSDDQVKVRGYRLHLAEIEDALVELPSVIKACAAVRRRNDGSSQLFAFLIADQDLEEVEIRKNLAERIAPYCIPDVITQMQAFPTTPNGKVDRQALLAMDITRAKRPGMAKLKFGAEAKLATIWKDVLGITIEDAGIPFFEAGGNSILALQALIKINNEFDSKLRLVDFFRCPTIREIALLLQPEEVTSDRISARAVITRNSQKERQKKLSIHRQGEVK